MQQHQPSCPFMLRLAPLTLRGCAAPCLHVCHALFLQARNSHDDTIRLTPLTEPVAVKSDVRKLQLKAAAPLAVGTDYVAQVCERVLGCHVATAHAMHLSSDPCHYTLHVFVFVLLPNYCCFHGVMYRSLQRMALVWPHRHTPSQSQWCLSECQHRYA